MEPHLREHDQIPGTVPKAPVQAAPVELQKAIIDRMCVGAPITNREDMWWLPTVEANEKAAKAKGL